MALQALTGSISACNLPFTLMAIATYLYQNNYPRGNELCNYCSNSVTLCCEWGGLELYTFESEYITL
eukprot:5877879-Amphidinium_carterae.1